MRHFLLTNPITVCLVLSLAAPSCHREDPKPPKAKSKKSSEVVVDVFQQRQAFNSLTTVLRQLAASPPGESTSARRAAHLRTQLLTIPTAHLSPALRQALDSMLQALAAAESNPAAVVPADLQKQGAEAAAALNQALAAEGLMEFKF